MGQPQKSFPLFGPSLLTVLIVGILLQLLLRLLLKAFFFFSSLATNF